MIYILIELNGFRQLKKIDNKFTETVTDAMANAFSGESCRLVEQKQNVFIYGCKDDGNNTTNLFANTLEIFNYLKSSRDKLAGFNILITTSATGNLSEEPSVALGNLLSLSEDESFYTDGELVSVFGEFAEFEKKANFYRLVSYNEFNNEQEGNIITFLSKSDGIVKYLDFLEPYINGAKRGLVYFYGKRTFGLSFPAFALAKAIEGNTQEVPWLFIKSDNSTISDINSLLKCMSPVLLREIESYLTGVDLALWKSRADLVKNSNRIIFDEDALILFRLYLKAYSLKMKELYLPGFVYILNSHSFDESTLDYIAIILEDLYLDLDLIPVVFSEDEDLPAVFDSFKGKKMEIGTWTLDVSAEDSGKDGDKSIEFSSPVSFYHGYMLMKGGGTLPAEKNISKKFINELGFSVNHFLLLYSLFYDLCSKDLFFTHVIADQQEKLKSEKIYKELSLHGFLYPDDMGEPFYYGNSRAILSGLDGEVKAHIPEITDNILKSIGGFKLISFEKSVNLYRTLEIYREEALSLLKTIDLLIDSGKSNKTGPFFQRLSVIIKKYLHGTDKTSMEVKQNISFLKAAIYDNRDDFAGDVFTRLSNIELKDPILNSERKISCSDYLYAQYKLKKALDLAKSALLEIQDSSDTFLKTRVNFTIAKILMGMKRIDESKDYFRIAKEILVRERDVFKILEISTYESVVNFNFGNFSESLRLIASSLDVCEKTGYRDWQLFLVFIKGRILFELGDYNGAVENFTEGLRLCGIYFEGNKRDIFNIWLGRCFIYLREYKYGLAILEDYESSSEALYFTAEGLFFLEEYNNSFKVINKAFNMEKDRIRLFCSSNITSWESGYDFIEDRTLVVEGGHGVLFQLIMAFKAFLTAKTGDSAEGWKDLVRLSREDRLSDTDLNNGYYYYLHALTLPENSGAQGVDRITLLSKALRHIQHTSSKIDDPGHRQMYLNQNYWNGRLMTEGRLYKLI